MLRHFLKRHGKRLWREFGFVDAFCESQNWYADTFLAIDQGPIIVMIENHRTGLLWKLFMAVPEVQAGLRRLGFVSPHLCKPPAVTAQDRQPRAMARSRVPTRRDRDADEHLRPRHRERAPGLRADHAAGRRLDRRLARAGRPTTRIRTTFFIGSGIRRSSSTPCGCSTKRDTSARRRSRTSRTSCASVCLCKRSMGVRSSRRRTGDAR